jgi:LEA14-like dessication related protein
MRIKLCLAALALTLLGCDLNVERPRLVPREVQWQGVNPQGVVMRIVLAAYNPNSFDLPLHDLNATLALNGQGTGSSVTNLNVTLPARREVGVTVDVTMPLEGGLTALGVLMGGPQVQYHLEGTVTVEHYISVNTHFTQDGVMPRDVLTRSVAPQINSVINYLAPMFNSSGGQAPVVQPGPGAPPGRSF